MGREFNRRVIAFIRPPLLAIRFVAKPFYSLLFGWLDRKTARDRQNRFAREIGAELPFLFKDYGGHVIPNEGVRFLPGFDYAVVTVELCGLVFRFIRGRGDLDIYVASRTALKEWHNVLLVIRAMEDPDDMRYTGFIFLRDAAVTLKKKMPLIQEAFSSARFPETKEHLANHQKYAKAATKQLENEINRRLHE